MRVKAELYLAFESRYFSCLQIIRELGLITDSAGEPLWIVESVAEFDTCGAGDDAYIFRIAPGGAAA